jgi:hypothetical protein
MNSGPGATQSESSLDDEEQSRVSAAAGQVFQIAVDEMRHLMWANLVLRMLGAPASTGRAERIAEPPDPERNGRKALQLLEIKYLDKPFELKVLDRATLDWFIQVEAPSKTVNEGLDGMYVYILEALELRKREIPNAAMAIPIIKLIIDEGEGHWERFERIKQTLGEIPEEHYLRKLSQNSPNEEEGEYLNVCDSYYQLLMEAIELSLTLGDTAQAQLVGAAIRIMRSLDEMAFVLARRGFLPRFALLEEVAEQPIRKGVQLSAAREVETTGVGGKLDGARALSRLESVYSHIESSLVNLRETGAPDTRLRAARHRQRLAQHIAEVDTILVKDLRSNTIR